MNIIMKRTNNLIFILAILIITSHNPTGIKIGYSQIKDKNQSPFVEITHETGLECPQRSRTAAWVDFNNDDHLDIFVCNGHNQKNALFRNMGNGSFVNIIQSTALTDALYTYYAQWIDINNDGYKDLFTDNYQKDLIYLNDENFNFTDISPTVNFQNGNHTVWADYDCDGLIDAYVCRMDEYYTQSSSPLNSLYRNMGNGSFKDVAATAGVDGHEDSGYANWIDLDKDGYLDIHVSNMNNQQDNFYRNNGDGTFSDIYGQTGLSDHDGISAFADFNNDSHYDLLIIENNSARLYLNNGNCKFTDISENVKFDLPDSRWLDVMCSDFNNDGYMDIHLQCVLSDSNKSRFFLYQNRGNGVFEDISSDCGIPDCPGYFGHSWSDYDNDGDLDLYYLNWGENRFYKNMENSHHWIKVKLTGQCSNRDGIGARITIKTGSLTQSRYCGIGQCYKSNPENSLLFGSGEKHSVDRIRIEWPCGIVQDTANIHCNQIICFTEPTPALFTDVTELYAIQNDIHNTHAAAILDVNNDKLLDILVANHEHEIILYQNSASGHLANVASQYGLDLTGYFSGVGVGDFNNDGYDDLYLARAVYSPNTLLLNKKGKRFVDVTENSGAQGASISSEDVVLGDFNNDGYLDIYVGNDGPNALFFNNGNMTFSDATKSSGTGDSLISRCTAADYDNDGDLDIYVANNRGGYNEYKIKDKWHNRLYSNNGDGTFTDVAEFARVNDPSNSKGCCFGDYDNDGFLDLYIGNDGIANRLYHNNRDGTFTDVTLLAGVAEPIGTHGVLYADFNNDGWLDIYACGGSYLPEQHTFCVYKDHPDILYINNRDGTFEKIGNIPGMQLNMALTNSMACGDIDADGDLDIFLANTLYKGIAKTRNTILRNNAKYNNWVQLKLFGRTCNRAAIGSRIKVSTHELTQIREVSGGDGGGSHNSLVVAFGLGKTTQIDTVTINWPDGLVQYLFDVPVNSLVNVHQPYQFGTIQMSAHTVTLIRILFIASSLFALIILSFYYKFLPRIITLFRRIRIKNINRKTDQSESASSHVKNFFKICINLIPFREDMLLSYSVKSPEYLKGKMVALTDFQSSIAPYAIKTIKLQRLNQEIDQLLQSYSFYLRTGETLSMKTMELMKKIGTQIYRYFGLVGLLELLFDSNVFNNLYLNFTINDQTIPWQWAFNSKSEQFLCDSFPVSITLVPESQKKDNEAENRKLRGSHGAFKNDSVVLFYGDWKGHRRELKKVNEEIEIINQLLDKTRVKTYCIYQDIDTFVETVNQINDNGENLRIIHYSGHIDNEGLMPGVNEYLPLRHLYQSYGLEFPSRPLIFFNGCCSGHIPDASHSSPDWVIDILKLGARACIVTRFHIPELSAKNFASRFYHYFITHKLTAGRSLQYTRRDMALKQFTEEMNPDYDITRYLYDLYGDSTLFLNSMD